MTFPMDFGGPSVGTARAGRIEMYASPLLSRYLTRLEDLPRDVVRRAALEASHRFQEEARRNLRSGGPRGLHVRTGRLRDATEVQYRETPQGATMELRTLFYGVVNARGMVIRAKNGPYLVFRTARGFARVRKVTIPKRDWDVAAAETVQREFPRFLTGAVSRIRT